MLLSKVESRDKVRVPGSLVRRRNILHLWLSSRGGLVNRCRDMLVRSVGGAGGIRSRGVDRAVVRVGGFGCELILCGDLSLAVEAVLGVRSELEEVHVLVWHGVVCVVDDW